MTVVAATSALLAFFNLDDPDHAAVARALDGESAPPVVSPFVVAELDYLMMRRWGVEREIEVIRELASGAYELATVDEGDLLRGVELLDRYRDQAIGIADASIVILADRCHTRRVLTLDRRHFDVLRPLSGGRFTVVP